MSIDAGLYLRWRDGRTPSPEHLAAALDLHAVADPRGWRRVTAADGSVHWVRISADAYDRLGPSVTDAAERAYDYWLHISPSSLPPEVVDTPTSLRAYCREAVERLRGGDLVESSFDVDYDCHASYWTDLREAFSSGLPHELEVNVWWAAAAELGSARESVARALAPGLQYAAPGPGVVASVEGTNAVAEAIRLRAGELPYQATARITGTDVPAAEVDASIGRIIAELLLGSPEVDVAVWINDRLCRYEVALTGVSR